MDWSFRRTSGSAFARHGVPCCHVWAVIAIAAPLYWLGFANEQMPFIVPGVLIVFLAKFLPETQPRVGS